ncbi:MAG: ribbon-helix-helix domain-containing protein [Oscillospiraceae bacterium]|nr:ribbon-helix-helix domain-containing protein [Oscillospiraceae bacterium]
MPDKKLVIKPQKYGGETTVVSLRIAKSMLADIDKVAAATGRSRSELLTLFIEFSLKNLEIDDN